MQLRGSWTPRGHSLAAALVACACACSGGTGPVAPGPVAPDAPTTSLQGVVLEGYAGGKTDFRVRADSAVLDPLERAARLSRVRIEFADRESGPVQVEAAEGRFALDKDDFELFGGVVGQTGEGERFETENLHYHDATRTLVTDSLVRMTRSNLVFEGRGMQMNVDSRRLRFTGRITATSLPAEPR